MRGDEEWKSERDEERKGVREEGKMRGERKSRRGEGRKRVKEEEKTMCEEVKGVTVVERNTSEEGRRRDREAMKGSGKSVEMSCEDPQRRL